MSIKKQILYNQENVFCTNHTESVDFSAPHLRGGGILAKNS